MAYNKTDMVKQSLKAIEENDLVFIDEIISFVPFSRATFYNNGLDKLDNIKKALNDNRVKIKAGLRKDWRISKHPVLQIALYRLLATDDEYERLILQKFDHTSRGESMKPVNINVTSPKIADEIKQIIDGTTDKDH